MALVGVLVVAALGAAVAFSIRPAAQPAGESSVPATAQPGTSIESDPS